MISCMKTAVLVGLTWLVAGCGTFLSIGEAPANARDVHGVAVNRRAAFVVSVDSHVPQIKDRKSAMSGVHPRSVVTVNIRRMPFGSGKLVVKLNGEQLLKEVNVTSQTGAVRAVQAADPVLKTAQELKGTDSP